METIKNLELKPSLIDYIAQWRDKPGNLIMILHKAQEEYGFIPRDVAFKLAEVLDVPLAKIYGVITFYHFFKLEKRGKNIINVCMGTACYLKGGEDIIKELEIILGVGLNTVTPDGKFSVEAVRCLGCCGLAPVVSINGTVYGKLSKNQLPEILSKY
ncbi:MAG TPA: NAD(P)H-dependent oxidoreductase subunit E [Candidatus Omnitrophota bacterium]|nr:NAD(P)H-dependent oxidoreductase subunit E [Candidatus Omnitrophota bacterium]